MADPFQPKFVDLVRNYSTTTGTGNFALGPAVNGYTGFAAALQTGDSFYYSAIGVDKPAEREVGRGTLLSGGAISRSPISGAKTNFSNGTKSIALIAAAEWFGNAQALVDSVSPLGQSLASAASAADARTLLALGTASTADCDDDELLAADSAAKVPSQRAVKAYVDRGAGGALLAANNLSDVGDVTAARANLGVAGATSVKWFGAAGDGATDDTSAFAAAFAATSKLHIPAGTYVVSSIVVPAGASVSTDGFDTVIRQKPGTADATRILVVGGSNVRIGDIAVAGQIAANGGEQNHGLFIQANAATGNLQNVTIGNVRATDIRGDAVYIGGDATRSVKQVSVGHIVADNCYRNGLTITDNVHEWMVASVHEGACGQHTVDIEPNGTGPVRSGWIGAVRGRHVSVAGTSVMVEATIENADLDASFGSNSTPPNPFDHKVASQAAGTQNAIVLQGAVLQIGRLRANGYSGQAIVQCALGPGVSRLSCRSAELTNICTSDTVYNAFILAGEHDFGELKATTTLPTHCVFAVCSNSQVGKATVALAPLSKYMSACTDCRTASLFMTAAGTGNGGIALMNCTRCHIYGGVQAGDRLFSNCTRCAAAGVDATMATAYDASPLATNLLLFSRIGGTYVYLNDQTGAFAVNSGGGLASTGAIRSSSASAGIGYSTGAGGTVAQATSKSSGVTLNKACGQITMNGAALAASTTASFTLTNSAIAATDLLILNHVSGGTAGAYCLNAQCAAGSASINVRNISGSSLSEAIVIAFALQKAVIG